jgi:hypothetical protein
MRARSRLLISCLAGVGSFLVPGALQPATEGQAPLFERDIAPIFQARCVRCHGLEDLQAGLDLRTPPLALKGSARGPVIVKGFAEKSLLYQKVATSAMPPTKTKLSKEQIDMVRRWIDSGAQFARSYTISKAESRPVVEADREHWAFRKYTRPSVPTVRHPDLVRTPVDTFILARLDTRNLVYAAPANRETLIRRAYLDLTGLLPTPEQVDAFVNDSSPNAWEKLVDGLLASPHFGERWGRHWLDEAGYSDILGGDTLNTKALKVVEEKHRYRDYVIQALNRDEPYDQFLREQLAGDEMYDWRNADKMTPEAREALVATGFLRNAPDDSDNNMGGNVEKRLATISTIIQNVSTNLLGLTVGCAQCHSHKFDPIPQTDYYSMVAIFSPAFNTTSWEKPRDRYLAGVTPKEQAAIDAHNAAIDEKVKPLQKQLASIRKPYEEKIMGMMIRAFPSSVRKDLVKAAALKSEDRDTVQQYLVENIGPLVAKIDTLPVAQVEVTDPNDLRGQIEAAYAKRAAREQAARGGPVKKTVTPEDEQEVLQLFAKTRRDIVAAIGADADDRTELQTYLLRSFIRMTRIPPQRVVPMLSKEDKEKYAAIEAQIQPFEAQRLSYPKLIATYDVGPPPATYLLRRGDVNSPTEPVPAAAPSILVEPGGSPVLTAAYDKARQTAFTRLEFADWITKPGTIASSLVARVRVNRIWQHLFGEGIVRTPENFGRNGMKPSHPELLDWLAVEFSSNGWHIKPLIKRIMMSGVYMQSSARPDAQQIAAIDAGNELLAGFPLKRLESEIIRDAVLSASGKLDPAIGGPSVRLQYFDDGHVAISKKDLPTPSAEYRRGMYMFTRRGHNLTMMRLFDQPNLDASCMRRTSSAVVMQSLTMLNGDFMLEQADFMAERVLKSAGPSDADHIDLAFRIALGRHPNASERGWSQKSLAGFTEAWQQNKAKDGEQKALASLCQTLLNTNEFLYVR